MAETERTTSAESLVGTEFMTVARASRVTGLSRYLIEQEIITGHLRMVRIGLRDMIPVRDVDALIERLRSALQGGRNDNMTQDKGVN